MRQPRPAEPGLVHIYDPALGLPAIPKEVRVTDPVYDQAYFDQEKRAESARTLAAQFDSKEVRVTDAKTGGQKGKKMARFDMIPSDVLWEVAEHYGKGEAKYPSEPDGQANWQLGYDWRLSVAALQRHLHQFLIGEDVDAETGSHHMVAVIWHAIAIRWFQIHGKGKDYRSTMR